MTNRSSDAAVDVTGLVRHFRVPVRPPGLRASIRGVVRREHRVVRAVDGIDLRIERGSIVGVLGPNGAGKTTTLKMLSGLLHPTAGTVAVLGHEPARRDHAFLRRISLVMGQRQQLNWDLPAADSFDLLAAIYDIDPRDAATTVEELTDLLDLDGLLDKPVRQLSLGERMKCELAASLVHRPEILFLDEPTLGLDVAAQRRVREFVAAYARATGATVLLTSHYMADIEALAERVVVIHHGTVQFDGSLRELTTRTSDRKLVTVRFDPAAGSPSPDVLRAVGSVVEVDGAELVVDVARSDLRGSLTAILEIDGVIDIAVEDEPVERIVERVFDAAADGAPDAGRS